MKGEREEQNTESETSRLQAGRTLKEKDKE
jgi:hypothetical protein